MDNSLFISQFNTENVLLIFKNSRNICACQ